MHRTQYKLCVDEHKNNICAGINYLQQNNEFVDMTLAADGHFVKVHQFLMAISSPYLKELIKLAACPQPVIFLHKVSYESLSAILQYIYTGEVLVSSENIKDLLEAAKSLHIVGLESMEIKDHEVMTILRKQSQPIQDSLVFTCQLQNSSDCTTEKNGTNITDTCEMYSPNIDDDNFDDRQSIDGLSDAKDDTNQKSTQRQVISMQEVNNDEGVNLFYGLSNRGAIQLICNRFIYFPAYSYKNKSLRRWRCVDNIDKSCPAFIITKDGMVVRRMKAHNHPFHDNRILKKTQRGQIFATIQEAQENTTSSKTTKSKKT